MRPDRPTLQMVILSSPFVKLDRLPQEYLSLDGKGHYTPER